MGQTEIAKILKSNYPIYLSYKNVMQITGLSKSSVIRCLNSLKLDDELEIKITWGKKKTSRWKECYRIRG